MAFPTQRVCGALCSLQCCGSSSRGPSATGWPRLVLELCWAPGWGAPVASPVSPPPEVSLHPPLLQPGCQPHQLLVMAQPGGLLCSLICFDQLQGFYASRGSPRSRVGPLAGQVRGSCTSCVQHCAAPIRHKLKGLCGTPTAFNIRAPNPFSGSRANNPLFGHSWFPDTPHISPRSSRSKLDCRYKAWRGSIDGIISFTWWILIWCNPYEVLIVVNSSWP